MDRKLLGVGGYFKTGNVSVKYMSTYLVNSSGPINDTESDGHPITRKPLPLIYKG
jgi:hypothetical protein